jgi:hypothetical protein
MTDLVKFKNCLLDIGCNFTSCITLVGSTISVYSEMTEMQFEFDIDGKFIRAIS